MKDSLRGTLSQAQQSRNLVTLVSACWANRIAFRQSKLLDEKERER